MKKSIPTTLYQTAFLGVFCLFFCVACSSPKPQTLSDFTAKNPTKIHLLNRDETLTATADGFWDVSDVNTSHLRKDLQKIALTFDDAPTYDFENLTAIFAEYNAQNPDCIASATVFMNGVYLRDNPIGAQSALAVGFEFGNHSDNHLRLSTLSPDELLREIQTVDERLQVYDGKPFHLFRPPYGQLTKSQANSLNVPIVNWSIDTMDWSGKSADEIFETVMQNKYDGAIVLLHDGYTATREAVKRLLPALKQSGFQAVSVSQLSKANNRPLKNGATYIRARKP